MLSDTHCRIKYAFMMVLYLFVMSISAAVSAKTVIPEALQEWVPWVLKDELGQQCPFTYNGNDHFCAYPGLLSLDLKKRSGSFQQTWTAYADSWVKLPGDLTAWPQNVLVNDLPVPVMSRDHAPAVQLPEGRHLIRGEFSWQQKPKVLAIPAETGLIELMLDGEKRPLPDFRNGRLWLKTDDNEKHQNNRLTLQVFRKITDDIPVRMTTQLLLEVSGQQREIILAGAVLEGFMPSGINSALPAQIDRNGRLKVQIRAGRWTLDIQAFSPRQLQQFDLPAMTKPWPENEIWVFQQQSQLRLVKVIDKQPIDANQSKLPTHWKSLPAYSMHAGSSLKLNTIKRGNPEPEPDQLVLNKKIWLDFDGKGFTVNDDISGKLSRQWRLNAMPNIQLGQVTINGKPQYITQNQAGKQGVEVRHGKLQLSADSRLVNNSNDISATGWDLAFNKVNATLYLPPGWTLLSLSGAEANRTWINKWTLLDLFIVLVTAIAIYKLWGVTWGLLGLLTLALVWHESYAPQFVWINLVVAVVLLKALPKGRLFQLVNNYRLVTSLVLILITLPFVVNQARVALYPQLAFNNQSINNQAYQAKPKTAVAGAMVKQQKSRVRQEFDDAETLSERAIALTPQKAKSLLSYSDSYQTRTLKTIDPDAMIQTGPGLPSWTLHQYPIRWHGPVAKDQSISMLLLSPAIHFVLNLLRIALVVLLAWRLLDLGQFKGQFKLPRLGAQAVTKTVLLFSSILFLSGLTPKSLEAAYPPKALLNDLRAELLKPADCLPQCASIESLTIDLNAQQLHMSLIVHAQEKVLLPLPIPIKQWMPERLMVDEKQRSGLLRHHDNKLWLPVGQGQHSIRIKGRVDYLSQLQLDFPLKPYHINVQAEAWSVEGLNKQTDKINALTFLRKVDKNNTSTMLQAEQNDIPVYAKVTRSLELGVDWYVTTRVQGVSGTAYPVIFNVPLLAGEAVISDNIIINNNAAVVTLNNDRRTFSWTSTLTPANALHLQASSQAQFIEKWTLDASPIWHIDYQGIPVIYHQRHGNNWRPEWQPWPGEEVSIRVSRPQGVKGNTVTIDSSTLTITPGEQITGVTLAFSLRSSLGGQHNIKLPADADLQSVQINNQNMPVSNTEEGLSLPVSPGNQKVVVKWREARGIETAYNTSVIDLGSDSVNHVIKLESDSSRWILFTSGPAMGPAVLFWGMLGIILLIAYALGRIKNTPMSTWQWILLGVGLSASAPWVALVIALTVLALKARAEANMELMSNLKFNGFQFLLVLLSLFSGSVLIEAIQQGLLGAPEMQIMGNGSGVYQLNWYSDRIQALTPQATMISVPVYVYRLMMLVWSIWLAFALIKWAQWGWGSFSKNGYWRSTKISLKAKRSSSEAADKK